MSCARTIPPTAWSDISLKLLDGPIALKREAATLVSEYRESDAMSTDVLAGEAVGVVVRASLPRRVAGVGADALT